MVRYYLAFLVLIVLQPIGASAQPKALAELFCNVNCGNCPTPDAEYGTYLSTHPGVVLINYHNSTTLNTDTFYLASLPAVQDRDYLYGGGGAQIDPNACIDGYSAGSIEGSWMTYSNDALGESFPATITSSISPGPNGTDSIFTTVTGSSSVQVGFYVAIKESQLYYVNSYRYGPTPGNLWNDIFRTMLPSGTGSTPFSLNGTYKDTEIYDPTNYIYNGNPQNMTAVIFVQDVNPVKGTNNYQIEALDTIPFIATQSGIAETAAPTTHLMISSNPLETQGHIGFDLTTAGDVRLSICDLLGREMKVLVDGAMPSGQTSVEMNSNILPAGCYIARLNFNGQDVDHAKFIVAP